MRASVFFRRVFALLIWGALVTMTGCSTAPPSATAETKNAIYTSAVETVVMQMTLRAGQEAIQKLTQIAQTPTPLPTGTSTPLPPTPTNTPLPPTATPVVDPCNRADLISEMNTSGTVDNPAGQYRPGDSFKKTWRVRNTGTCAWTLDYALVFVNGEHMDGPDVAGLGSAVRPGEMVDISVNLVSPEQAGEYFGYWMLRSDTGVIFGAGPKADQSLVVQIRVRRPIDVVFDFSMNYCNASWQTSAGVLQCPGWDGDTETGYVVVYDHPVLENGAFENTPAIITLPNPGSSGSISGQFPPFRIRIGDRFRTTVGCLDDSPACDVTFKVDYSADGESVENLAAWQEVDDKRISRVDLDLSFLAGKSVEFFLTVLNNGDSTDDRAFWLRPIIIR